MRLIVFRGKSLKDGSWVYGDLEYSRSKEQALIHSYTSDGIYNGQQLVDIDTVGQFTGMQDKNGKAIYEGDIVCRHETPFEINDVGEVVYNEAIGAFRIHLEKHGFSSRLSFISSETYNDGYCTVDCKYDYEVLGNVFDNSELLINNE